MGEVVGLELQSLASVGFWLIFPYYYPGILRIHASYQVGVLAGRPPGDGADPVWAVQWARGLADAQQRAVHRVHHPVGELPA